MSSLTMIEALEAEIKFNIANGSRTVLRVDVAYQLREIVRATKPDAEEIETRVRESIAREFDVLAGMLTDAMERTTVPIDLAICRDRRAQMATAAQMVRGKVTP